MKQRRTWIVLLIFGILSSSFLTSCKEHGIVEHITTNKYIYSNQTEHHIGIDKYSNGKSLTYQLQSMDSIEFAYEFNGVGCSIDQSRQDTLDSQNCFLFAADSLLITFDDSLTYWLKQDDGSVFNLFNNANYATGQDGNIFYYRYAFTESDYQHAK